MQCHVPLLSELLNLTQHTSFHYFIRFCCFERLTLVTRTVCSALEKALSTVKTWHPGLCSRCDRVPQATTNFWLKGNWKNLGFFYISLRVSTHKGISPCNLSPNRDWLQGPATRSKNGQFTQGLVPFVCANLQCWAPGISWLGSFGPGLLKMFLDHSLGYPQRKAHNNWRQSNSKELLFTAKLNGLLQWLISSQRKEYPVIKKNWNQLELRSITIIIII